MTFEEMRTAYLGKNVEHVVSGETGLVVEIANGEMLVSLGFGKKFKAAPCEVRVME